MKFTILPARFAPFLLSILRIAAGLAFLEHGTGKILGFPAALPFIDQMPWAMLTFTGYMELIGGVLLWPAAPTAQVARQQGVPAASNHHHDPVQEAADELQERYRTFISAQSSLTVPTDITLASLQILFDEREQLRQQSFTPTEQEQLFAEDRLMEQWTLRRKALAEANDGDKQMLASELELWLAAQPRWFQEA
jgi:hypothetical protein